ncbi:unnamed protein product [Penicillium nalgiovense]|nr:unnamed protein product [Penicillium nalgiovense]
MPLSYHEALRLVEAEARHRTRTLQMNTETLPLNLSLNRVVGCEVRSPLSTPPYDTSAMDGYALDSGVTLHASPHNPILFHVEGLVAAGNDPFPASHTTGHVYPCVEIMTGGRFPTRVGPDNVRLDCCVKFEDVEKVSESRMGSDYIEIKKPARYQQNRRSAGEDFQRHHMIMPVGTTIRPHHIMAMASVGVTEIRVLPKLRVGLYSTGSEFLAPHNNQPTSGRVEDANGPYIAATLADSGIDVDFLGILDDDVETMVHTLKSNLEVKDYDLVVSTGAVSTGRFDLVPNALQRLGAHIVFHKLGIRPGHPVMFATIPNISTERPNGVPFFGLPGNPVASAACLRFFVMHYIRCLQSQLPEIPLTARMSCRTDASAALSPAHVITSFPSDKDVFRPGVYHCTAEGEVEVVLIDDYSPGKVRPFLSANCWVHIRTDVSEVRAGDLVNIFPNT